MWKFLLCCSPAIRHCGFHGVMPIRGTLKPCVHDNDVIASFVIAGARIHLFSHIEKLQDKVLYCKTDSRINPNC